MRYLVTATGRRLHIVREAAYHGADGNLVHGLCGAWPKVVAGMPIIIPERHKARGRATMCKTCVRLAPRDA